MHFLNLLRNTEDCGNIAYLNQEMVKKKYIKVEKTHINKKHKLFHFYVL